MSCAILQQWTALTSNTISITLIMVICIINKLQICMANGWLEDQDQVLSTVQSEFWRNAQPITFRLHRAKVEK